MYMENEGGREKTWCGERLVAAWTGKVRAPQGTSCYCAALGLSLQRGWLLGGVPWIHFKGETRKHSFCPKKAEGKLPALAEMATGPSGHSVHPL